MSLQVEQKTFIQTDVLLKSFTTYKIGGSARFFAQPQTQDELIRILEFRQAEGLRALIIGRGSNLLISDAGFDGLAISLRQLDSNYFSEEQANLTVSAGMSLCHLSSLSQELSLGGLEFLCHIPGSVGGAVIMNAGFGRQGGVYSSIQNVFESLTAVDLNGHVKRLNKTDICFNYRRSDIPADLIILQVKFTLSRKSSDRIESEIKANFEYRNMMQDLRYPSAGSTFKNPKNSTCTSGQLLDRVGMKKMRIGGAMVSDRHANFFLNVDRASSQDVLDLMTLAKKRVFDEFGIELEPEVRYVA